MLLPSEWKVSNFTVHIIGKEIQIFKIELAWGKASLLQLLAPNVFSWSTKCFKENIPSIKVFR